MRTNRVSAAAGVVSALAVMATPGVAGAQRYEGVRRVSIHGEGAVDMMLAGWQRETFELGFHGTARLGVTIVGPLSVQVSGGSWFFTPRQSAMVASPLGRVVGVEGGLRLAPRLGDGAVGGPVLDANAGLAFTGGAQRVMFDAGLGWEFAVHPAVNIGPVVRYTHVLHDSADVRPDDAQILGFGLSLTVRPPPEQPAGYTPGDRDGDGLLDPDDQCPAQPEDVDGFRDEDGCPDPDNDADGVLDPRDRCPAQVETHNNFQDDDGCPDEAPRRSGARVENNRIVIEHTVPFDFDSDNLQAGADAVLMEVVEVLRAHPEIRRIRVEGHADFRGTPQHNLDLSTRRAAAVARFLRERGVNATQIDSAGFGTTRPLCNADTEECHTRNRRVEFVITEGPGAQATP